MEELIQTFHIDWKLLIAQIVNFSLVVGVLGFFAFRPLLKMMADRRASIERGVADAEDAKKNLADAAKEREKQIINGRLEAQKIMETASTEAEAARQDKVAKTQDEIKKVVAEAKAKLSNEKEQILIDAKNDLGELIVMAMQKVLGDSLDAKTQTKLVERAIEELEQADLK